MTITINRNGSITISTVYKGYRIKQSYIGYTKRQAVRLFRAWLKQSFNLEA